MITMFNLDGPNRLLMTHYCAAGNQPRMQASVSPDGKTITFNFVDATNLASPDAGHMQQMVLTVLDDNHHTEDWTFIDHGKEMKSNSSICAARCNSMWADRSGVRKALIWSNNMANYDYHSRSGRGRQRN